MSETAVRILQFTHHGLQSRSMEYKTIKCFCGNVEKIICTNVAQGIELVKANTELLTATIDLIFLEFNLGASGETNLTVKPEDFELLLTEYPPAHVHFFSGGTSEMNGYEEFLQSIKPEYHERISNGVGKAKYGIELIPDHLKKPSIPKPITAPPSSILAALQDIVNYKEKESTVPSNNTLDELGPNWLSSMAPSEEDTIKELNLTFSLDSMASSMTTPTYANTVKARAPHIPAELHPEEDEPIPLIIKLKPKPSLVQCNSFLGVSKTAPQGKEEQVETDEEHEKTIRI